MNRPSRSSASECEAARLSQRLYRRAMSWLKRILSGHGRVQRVCKPNCKPTAQHGMIPGITSQHVRVRKAKLEHTLRHRAQPPSLIGSNSEQTLLIPGSPAVILAYVGDKSRALRSRLIVPGDAHGASSVRDVAGAGRTRMSGASASAMLRNAVRSSPRSGPIR